MRIEAFDRFLRPISSEVTRVVIYDDFDNPVAVAVKHEPGWIYVAHCKDPEFFDFLEGLGIQANYKVDSLDLKNLKKLKSE
jgi:hypothetical protein